RTRKRRGRRPESDSPCQRKLQVAAQQKLLKQSHEQEHHRPERRQPRKPRPMQQHMPEPECMRSVERQNQQADTRKSPRRPRPESQPKSAAPRQSKTSPRPPLHLGKNNCRYYRRDQVAEFLQSHIPEAVSPEVVHRGQRGSELLQHKKH